MRYLDLMTVWRMAIVGSTVMSAVLVSDVAQAEENFRASSEIKGISIAPASVLPAAPASAKKRTDCEDFLIKPKTAAGQLVAAKGWAVTGEVKIGSYTAVSFVGRLEFVGSGTCMMTRGNIGIFDDKLLGIAYTKQADDGLIGTVTQLDGGGARLYDGNLGAPVADLKLTDVGEFSLTSLAAFDSVCSGKAKVPNVANLPIDKARKLSSDAGWKPVPAKPETDEGYESDLRKAGLTEAESCAGTGMGYCNFDYEGAAGKLSVTTMGTRMWKRVIFRRC
jgi:hypothetical protein